MSGLLLESKDVLARLGIWPEALRDTKSCLQRHTYLAIVNYLTRYRAKPGSPNIERLHGYLEAFNLLCTLSQWERADALLKFPLATERTVDDQLQVWGYAQVRVGLHHQLLDQLPPQDNSRHLNALASSYATLGAYAEAAGCAEQALVICRELNDTLGISLSYMRLGYVAASQSQFQAAIAHYRRAIEIAQVHHYPAVEAEALANLGGVYTARGAYGEAVEVHQQSLLMTRQLKDLRGESYSLKDLGNVFFLTGDYDEATAHYQQAVALAQTIEDSPAEAECLKGLGSVFTIQRNFVRAVDCYTQAQKIAKAVGDLKGQLGILTNLGNLHALQRQGTQAAALYQEALNRAKVIGDLKAEGDLCSNLGTVQHGQKDYAGAIAYYRRAIAISQQTQDRGMEARCLNNLGSAQRRLGNYPTALDNFRAALAIKQTIGDRHGEAQTWFNLGQLWAKLTNLSEAEIAYETARSIFQSLALFDQAARCENAEKRLRK